MQTKEQIEITWLKLSLLKPDPFNPRRIPDAELEKLTRSIQKFGFVDPVIVRSEDMTVIGGHQRMLAARRLGYEEVPSVVLDVSVEDARLLNLALNKISGDFDTELLGRLLQDLSLVPDLDLSLSGFDDDEVTKLLRDLEKREKRERIESFDLDAALEAAQAAPRAQRGEVWALGDHRVMCGDSTERSDVERLMDGKKATLLATDPPYLVNYDSGEREATKSSKRKTSKHWDDFHSAEASIEFFMKYLRAAVPHLAPKTPVYQWHATIRQHLVMKAWEECGLHLHQTIVWVKPRGVLTRSHFMWRHEPCFYGWVEGQQPTRKPPANCTTIWEIGGENDNLHPTQKPLEVFLRPLEYHTEVGDVVYEPFLGSGTQIIAADKLSRRCFAMDLEPRYVDVAILRWEAFSGRQAVRLE